MAKKSDMQKGQTINPFIDWSFKHIFGREESKDLLVGFLNVLLKRDIPIRDITYLNNEHIPEDPQLRTCVFDVICTDEEGDRFLVEMQHTEQRNIRNRLIYYACRLINEMGRRGDWNYDIGRVYAICLMDFTYDEHAVLRNDYLLLDSRTGHVFSDRLNIITLQIPCIRANNLSECRESYEKCLYLLKSMRDNMLTFQDICAEIEAENTSEEVKAMLRRVANAANIEMLSEKDRVAYDYALKRYRDYYSGLKTAEEKGFDKGRQEGLQEGLQEGELKAKKEIALTMKGKGISPDMIVQCTGLSLDDINDL